MVDADILSRFSSESSEMPELDPDGRTFQRERRVPPTECYLPSEHQEDIQNHSSGIILSLFLFFPPFLLEPDTVLQSKNLK